MGLDSLKTFFFVFLWVFFLLVTLDAVGLGLEDREIQTFLGLSLNSRDVEKRRRSQRLEVDCRAPSPGLVVAFAGLGLAKVLWEELLAGVTAIV